MVEKVAQISSVRQSTDVGIALIGFQKKDLQKCKRKISFTGNLKRLIPNPQKNSEKVEKK